MLKYLKILALTIAVLSAPSAAMAVNLSSNDGNGDQHVTSHGDQSFYSKGRLRSTSGNTVYIEGVVVYNNYPDYNCGRIGDRMSSKKYHEQEGSCSQLQSIPPSADAAAWKICHYRPALPDGCGPQRQEKF